MAFTVAMRHDNPRTLQRLCRVGPCFDVSATEQTPVKRQGAHIRSLGCQTAYVVQRGLVDMLADGDAVIGDGQDGWNTFANTEGWADAPHEDVPQRPNLRQRITHDTFAGVLILAARKD